MTIIQVGMDYGTFIEASSCPQRIDRGRDCPFARACVCASRRDVRVAGQEDVDIGRSARGLKLCVVQSAATMFASLYTATSYMSPYATPCRDVIIRSIPH